jgi:hypothetical protein
MSNSLKPRAKRSLRYVLHPEWDSAYVHFANSAQHPFLSDETGVGRRNAWWLTDAALLSYWNPSEAIGRFRSAGLDATFIEVDGVQCYVSVAPEFVIVAFRGTQVDEWQDIFDDARFALVPWGNAVASRRVGYAGHSLGGALSVLTADFFGRADGICAIGAPRTGDATFAKAFETRFGSVTVRYVENNDAVTRLPPAFPLGYEHVGELRQIDAMGNVGRGNRVVSQVIQGANTDDATAIRTAAWLSILDHMPRGYAVDIWNDYARNGN